MRKDVRSGQAADGAPEDAAERPGCFGMLLRVFGGFQGPPSDVGATPPPRKKRLPYRLRDDFLSPGELSLFQVLNVVVGDAATVCPKVNLSDLFFVASSGNSMAHYNRIAQKHLDFLVCDPDTMRPLLGIELDDSSHRSKRARQRDAFEDEVFKAAGLPLVRIPQKRAYNPRSLAGQLADYIDLGACRTLPPTGSV
ncbi:MAG: DUF2726 domain-containing protein [Candidatus Brocadiia bacterium]